MMGKPWLKLWTETLHDRKLRRIDPVWRWAWIGVLMLAAESDCDGHLVVVEGMPLSDADIIDALGISKNDWHEASSYFVQVGMLGVDDAGAYTVTNYSKRQKKYDSTNADRQRRYRERKKAEKEKKRYADARRNAKSNAGRNATVTPTTEGRQQKAEGRQQKADKQKDEATPTTTPQRAHAGNGSGENVVDVDVLKQWFRYLEISPNKKTRTIENRTAPTDALAWLLWIMDQSWIEHRRANLVQKLWDELEPPEEYLAAANVRMALWMENPNWYPWNDEVYEYGFELPQTAWPQ